jgi:hypothetical protein
MGFEHEPTGLMSETPESSICKLPLRSEFDVLLANEMEVAVVLDSIDGSI